MRPGPASLLVAPLAAPWPVSRLFMPAVREPSWSVLLDELLAAGTEEAAAPERPATVPSRCGGCGEPSGHTTDCPVEPGRLRPHGSPAAIGRHRVRREPLCPRCIDATGRTRPLRCPECRAPAPGHLVSCRRVPAIPATPERLEALDGLIGQLAAALGTCEGCGEPQGHTTDCIVHPGRLAPHGTRGARMRHGRRAEEPCEKCRPREAAA